MKRRKKLVTITIIFFILIGILGYFAFTPSGSIYGIKILISKYINYDSIKIEEVYGNLFKGLVIKGVKVNDLRNIPAEDSIKIQELKFTYMPFRKRPFKIEVHNGRVNVIGADTIGFYGDYMNKNLDFTVYTKNLNLRFVLKKNSKGLLSDYSGDIKNIELSVKGKLKNPQFKGNFLISEIRKNRFKLVNCPGELDLKAKVNHGIKLFGDLLVESGILTGRKTADINIKKSRIFFNGNYENPSLDIKGKSKIGNVKINIGVKGSYENPKLKLSSQPPLPKQQLLLMITTNKRWEGLKESLQSGKFNPEVAKDLINYFVFAGSLSNIVNQLGMKNLILKIMGGSKGIKIKKNIIKDIDTVYGLKQEHTGDEKSISHKIENKYEITPNLSIGAERKIQESEEEENRIFLEFRSQF